ncbi:glycosyltransferase family 4 protein [Methyloceanibacter sp.]|uniref:glycosyltransferase family 4 protein n=1 Tax=Methyloceanibacter sp. TaxID=1965321 RepID=UPI003D6CD689
MRVCIVTTEFLGVGACGGVGVAARTLGRHLVARGVEVSVIAPRGDHHPPPVMEGISVRTYDRRDLRALMREARAADADVYHYIQASLGAYLGQWAMPDRAHVVECADPRDWADWRISFRFPTHSALRLLPSFAYFGMRPAALSTRGADAVQVPARFLQAKVRRLYGLNADPDYAPMPFDPPAGVKKSASPLVLFVGRLVPIKRPEIFLDVAGRFPNVRFVVIGGGSDEDYAGEMRRRAGGLKNVEFTDFIDQAADPRFFAHFSEAWVLINTAAREGLPLTFIEAAANGCAILSACNPDGYASNFGYHVTDGDFARGLDVLLADDAWRTAGGRAQAHAIREHVSGPAIERQLSIYKAALARSTGRSERPRLNTAPVVEQ